MEASPRDPVDALRRWEAAGAHWHVVAEGPHGVTVVLLTCTGGEEVSRFTSSDEALLAFVRGA
jgi:hypothetical protein